MRILTDERHTRPPEPPRFPVFQLAGLLLLVAGAAALYWWTGRGAEAPPAEPARPEAPATPAPPTMPLSRVRRGALEVTADVAGATVLLDGRRLGPAPQIAGELPSGPHTVRVVKRGYLPFSRRVEVVPGRAVSVRATLRRAPPPFRIDSDVPGASVYVDQEYLGTTPLETTRISPGSHRLAVEAEGYELYSETIELSPDSPGIVVRFKEVKLDERIDVVHKHGIGSCRGQLIASLDGLRYETDHKDHGFAVPLDGMKRFEVDYLKKNLRLEVRGGKKYNFTEPKGDADVLFVFHKAVDKVRLR